MNEAMTRSEIRAWYLRFQRLVKRRELGRMVQRASVRSVVNRVRNPAKLWNDARVVGDKLAGMF